MRTASHGASISNNPVTPSRYSIILFAHPKPLRYLGVDIEDFISLFSDSTVSPRKWLGFTPEKIKAAQELGWVGEGSSCLHPGPIKAPDAPCLFGTSPWKLDMEKFLAENEGMKALAYSYVAVHAAKSTLPGAPA